MGKWARAPAPHEALTGLYGWGKRGLRQKPDPYTRVEEPPPSTLVTVGGFFFMKVIRGRDLEGDS